MRGRSRGRCKVQKWFWFFFFRIPTCSSDEALRERFKGRNFSLLPFLSLSRVSSLPNDHGGLEAAPAHTRRCRRRADGSGYRAGEE